MTVGQSLKHSAVFNLGPRTVIDLKGFANQRERPVDVAIRLAIAEHRYDVQTAHYLGAYQALHSLAAQGRIFGDCPLHKDWHKRIVQPCDVRWTWIFHQTDGAPVSKGRELSPSSPVLNRATREVAEAKATYRACLEQFGSDPWTDREPVREFTEARITNDTPITASYPNTQNVRRFFRSQCGRRFQVRPSIHGMAQEGCRQDDG